MNASLHRVLLGFIMMVVAGCRTVAITADPPRLDHILLGVRSLDEGIAEFHAATGIAAQRGGRHPGRGTENALVSLGGGIYLEIIAPQREAATSDPFVTSLATMPRLTPAGWALRVNDIQTVSTRLRSEGIAIEPLRAGSRVTPAGDTLQWTAFGFSNLQSDAAPFFIEWSRSTRHPSETSLGGCSLQTFSVTTPSGAELSRVLRIAGYQDSVAVSERPKITVGLLCGGRAVTFQNE